MLIPPCPSGPTLTKVHSKPGGKPVSLQQHHSDIIQRPRHRRATKGNHHHKACVQRHRSPLHCITLSAHCP